MGKKICVDIKITVKIFKKIQLVLLNLNKVKSKHSKTFGICIFYKIFCIIF